MANHMLKADKSKEFYDVIVVGGGSAGIAAAVSCARSGLKALIIEKNGCFGGTSTMGALPFYLGAMTGSMPFRKMLKNDLKYSELARPRYAVKGIFAEIIDKINQSEGGVGPAVLAQTDKYPGLDRLGCHDEFTFNIEIGKRVLDEIVTESGADILFHSQVIATEVDNGEIQGVYVANKSGLSYIEAKTFIDCSGDADIAAYSGFDTYKGDRETGEMTAVSLVAHIENINMALIEQYLNEGGDPWFLNICKKAKAEHPDIDFPNRLIIFPMMQEGVFMINGGTSFFGYDGTCAEDLTDIMLTGRQRARVLVEELFRPYIPGAQNCRLRLTAYYPGIRETRRIVSEYTLTEKDLLEGKNFHDTVALAGRHFDLSREGSESEQPFHDKDFSIEGGITRIPYRSMIPRNTKNIIVAGRCIDAEGQALGPVRIMSTCFALGEAAGVAASIHLEASKLYRDVDADNLRSKLKNQGALVD